jgi:hypothetical protein
MLNKKYCEPYMIAAFIIIVILGVLYTGTAKINLQYVRGVEISRADILIRSELLHSHLSIYKLFWNRRLPLDLTAD